MWTPTFEHGYIRPKPGRARGLERRALVVLRLALDALPAEVAAVFHALLTPANMAAVAGFMGAAALCQVFPMTWLADLLVALGIFALGADAITAAWHLNESLLAMSRAKSTRQSDPELVLAAEHLAQVMMLLGPAVFMKLLGVPLVDTKASRGVPLVDIKTLMKSVRRSGIATPHKIAKQSFMARGIGFDAADDLAEVVAKNIGTDDVRAAATLAEQILNGLDDLSPSQVAFAVDEARAALNKPPIDADAAEKALLALPRRAPNVAEIMEQLGVAFPERVVHNNTRGEAVTLFEGTIAVDFKSIAAELREASALPSGSKAKRLKEIRDFWQHVLAHEEGHRRLNAWFIERLAKLDTMYEAAAALFSKEARAHRLSALELRTDAGRANALAWAVMLKNRPLLDALAELGVELFASAKTFGLPTALWRVFRVSLVHRFSHAEKARLGWWAVPPFCSASDGLLAEYYFHWKAREMSWLELRFTGTKGAGNSKETVFLAQAAQDALKWLGFSGGTIGIFFVMQSPYSNAEHVEGGVAGVRRQ